MVFTNHLFPTPVAVAQQMWTFIVSGKLLADMGKTLSRAATAFVVAMAIGGIIGVLLGRVRLADRLFASWVIIGLNMPAVVIAIALYIWLGLTEFALILAVIINKIPLVIVTIREGVRSFSGDYDELALAYRMPLMRRLRFIFVPQLVPYVLSATRNGLALVWKIVLVFEVIGSDGGIGFRIAALFQFFDIKGILAYTTAFILVVIVFEYGVVRPLERWALKWRTDPV
jgi:NitT/TauT family transport system permease protein